MKRALCLVALPVLLMACSSAAPTWGPASSNDGGGSEGGSDPDSGSTLSCDYPAGPYGSQQGAEVDADFQWKCAGPGVASTDLFDCDGAKGINALVFDISAEWCAACTAEAADFKTLAPQYEKLGVKVVTLMIQDTSHAPATVATATAWKQQYGLTVDVCADPKFSFQPSGSGSLNLPYTIVVDPRTMRIVHESQGYLSHYPLTPDKAILDLAKRNGATM